MGSKILIVDDDIATRDIYAALFRENGFDVYTANDGQEAFETMQSGLIPDVLLTGILMPRLTGFELVQKMRENPSLANVVIVISSHYGLPEHQKRAKELGVTEFIVRGVTSPGEILRRIQQLLGNTKKFRIAVLLTRHDGVDFIRLLNQQLETECVTFGVAEAALEVESRQEKGVFTIRLVC